MTRRHGDRVRVYVGSPGHRHELLGVAPHAVLADVEPVDLVALADAQADGLLDDPEEPKAEREHGDKGSAHRGSLGAELLEAARVDKATLADPVERGELGIGEQTARERTPDAGETVSAECTDRVVDPLVDGDDAEDHDDARDGADDDRRPRLHIATRG